MFVVGMSVVSLAVMGTSVRHVSSTVFALLVLLSFSVIKDWRDIFINLSKLEQVFLGAFVLYAISGGLSYYNADDIDKYYKILERYFRFLLVVPIYLFFIKKDISLLNFLYAGAVISGPFLLLIALQQRAIYPDAPAQGYYHHIIFGQLAMLNVGIMLSMLLTKVLSRKIQFVIMACIMCGLTAAVMSQARGVWLVFPFYIAIAVYYSISEKRISKNSIALLLVIIVLLSMFTSIGDLINQRTQQAISEVTRFYVENQYISSVGTRLAMWEIAFDVWVQNPMLGTGPGDFDDEILALQARGEYIGMPVHNSVHNIYIQSLVGSGVVGLIALVFVSIVMPLRLFLDKKVTNSEGQLAGFVTVVSFAIYGFSESWTLRLSAVSVFLVYLIVIASHLRLVNSKSNI